MGCVQVPWLNQLKLPSMFWFYLLFQNKYKIFQKFKCCKCSDFKGVSEIYIAKKQRRAWRNATSPSVQHTAHRYEDCPTSYSLLLFLLFLAPSLAKYLGECFFLAWPHVLASLLPLLASASWRNCFFAPFSWGTAPPGPDTGGLYSERSCYLYQLIPFSVAPSVCLPPWSLLAYGHCFPWSQ